MIDIYFTDEIKIRKLNVDINGATTPTTSDAIKARVEDYNKMIRNNKGQEVMGSMVIITNYSEPVDFDDIIIVTKKGGVAYDKPEKEFPIKNLSKQATFMNSHLEIII